MKKLKDAPPPVPGGEPADAVRRRLVFAGIATAGLAGCGGGSSGTHMAAESPPATNITAPTGSSWPSLPMLQNTSGPGQFSAALTASPTTANFLPGIATRILAYNGTTPGSGD